jgi:hypothetical protein
MVLRLGGSAVPRSRAGVVARALLGFVPGGRLQSTRRLAPVSAQGRPSTANPVKAAIGESNRPDGDERAGDLSTPKIGVVTVSWISVDARANGLKGC